MPPAAVEIALLVLAYVVGAIPTGLLVGKWVRGIDIREHGSKNIGATNVMRVLGTKLGAMTMVVDAGKAAGAVLLAIYYYRGATIPIEYRDYYEILAGACALAGNFFNIFLGGKGGKGVATSLGVFLALTWKSMTLNFGIWAFLVWATRLVSLASLVASISLPFTTWYFKGFGPLVVMIGAIATMITWRHRANIVRLWNGTEPKANFSKTPTEPPPAA